MTAVHRIFGNHRNLLLGQTLTAASTRPASDIRLISSEQEGNAAVALTGPYAGAADTTIDVEIVDVTVDTVPRVSAPAFSGAGNGTLAITDVSSGAAAQTVTLTLTDTGTVTTHAALNFDEVILQAKEEGEDGNDLYLNVDRIGLTFAASAYSLLNALSAGTDTVYGPEYDWDAKPADNAGNVPDSAHRLAFGDDETVYRQWKTYADGAWAYHFFPALERTIAAGTAVKFVSGSRVVTVSDGATTETYSSVVTPYDFLSQVQSASNLLAVVGVVVPDRQPGGMAMREFRARTDAHVLPSTGEGSAVATGLEDVVVTDTANTELIQAKCWDVAVLGKERWRVDGSVSGALDDDLKTNEPFFGAGVGFRIPPKYPDGYQSGSRGTFYLKEIRYANRGAAVEPPPICASPLVLGITAVDKELTLVYTKRPSTECECTGMAPDGQVSAACLGLDFYEGTAMATTPGLIARLQALAEWYSSFVAGNAAITAAGELRSAQLDIELAGLARGELFSCLSDLYNSGTLSATPWAAAAAKAVDAVVEPTARNGYRYRCTVAGTTHATTQPTWPTTVGNTVTDGTVTWKCVSKIPEYAWDDLLAAVDTELTALEGLGTAATATAIKLLAISTAYTAGDVVYYPTTGGTFYAVCTASGTTSGTITIIPSAGFPAVTNGTATFLGISLDEANARLTGDTEDANSAASHTSDPGIVRDPATFATKYRAACDVVRSLAGILPKSEAGGTGSACWQDPGDAYYWTVNGMEYLPAFSNQIYHSCVKSTTADGVEEIVSTQEFAFALNVKCDTLMEGDTVVLAIGDSGWPTTYQIGDVLTLPVIAATDLYLTGGATGDDTLHWSVSSSTAGALPVYDLVLAAPEPYAATDFECLITPGAIPFSAGDAFSFALEGGHFKWRRDGGAWSASTALADSQALADGLTLVVDPGPAPGLVAGDTWTWLASQPYAASQVRSPIVGTTGHQWTGATQTLAVDLGAETAIPAALVALHSLPPAATLTLAGSLNGSTWWTEAFAVRAGPLVLFPATPRTARYLELRITLATGARIGWWWVGMPWSPTGNATTIKLSRAYGMARGAGLNPAALYRGVGRAGELAWQGDDGDWLEPVDMTEWLALLDRSKAQGDEPWVLVPNVAHPEEAALVVADADEVTFDDVLCRFQDPTVRVLSASIPLRAVLE